MLAALLLAPASNVHSPVAPTAVPACAGGGGQVLTGATGTWTVLPAPHFPTGPAPVTAHVVDPLDPTRWYVTNGKAVLRSADGGCTWTPVYALPAGRPPGSPLSRDTDRVAAITVAAGSSTARRVHLAVEVLAEASPDAPVAGDALPPEGSDRVAAATAVVTSEDDGGSWQPPVVFAHSPGGPGPLRAAPGDPQVVYAVAGGALNVSRDGGRSWEARPPVADPDQAASDPDVAHLIRDLAVDPLDPDELWVRSGASLLHSTDGGRSWVRLTKIAGTGLHGPEVIHPAGVLARLLVTAAPDPHAPLEAMIVSDDAGRTWRRYPVEVTGSHQSMTHGAPDELVLTTSAAGASPAGVYRTAAGTTFGDVDEFALAPLLDVQAQRAATSAFHFRSPTGLVVYRPAVRPPAAAPPGGPPTARPGDPAAGTPPPIPSFEPPVQPPPPPARLEPARFEVLLAPGGSASVEQVLHLPARPSPLDVFLLVDTSDSMDPVIHELARGLADLVRRLTAAGIDAHIGLGEFQGIAEDEVRYRRRVDISPPGPALQAALGDLYTRGGEEPHLTALHQMATGAGLAAPGTGPPVPAGQQATWRQGSLRVVVMPTDEAFGHDPDGPDRDTTVAALRAVQVRHIGIEVPPQRTADAAGDALDLDGQSELRGQLEDLSRATGALAPDGGVDCDGDGRAELAAGEPLVCGYSPAADAAIADVLARMMVTLVDLQPVTLAANGPAAFGLQVTPAEGHPDVDVKTDQRLPFTVTFACSRAAAGEVGLRALVGGRAVATATALVTCSAPSAAVAVPPPDPAPPPRPPPAAQPPPPLPPPALPAPAGGAAEVASLAEAQALEQAQVQAGQLARLDATQPAAALVAAPAERPAAARADGADRETLPAVARREAGPGVAVPAGAGLWAVAVAELRRRTRTRTRPARRH